MREHVGVDVDAMTEQDYMPRDEMKPEDEQEVWDPESEQEHGGRDVTQAKHTNAIPNALDEAGEGIKQGLLFTAISKS